jgi:arsenate reductase
MLQVKGSMVRKAKMNLSEKLKLTVSRLLGEFNLIPPERKVQLKNLTLFIQNKIKVHQKVSLNFICTHNSRRSQIGQIWAQCAAYCFNVPGVYCFSGGTEATEFNSRALHAVQEAGFEIKLKKEGNNPVYEVRFSEDAAPIIAFSKTYDDPFNHTKDFAAIMTCSHADENCPFIPGASARIAITYDDPKDFDNTPLEASKYRERMDQIGREILYAFSEIELHV